MNLLGGRRFRRKETFWTRPGVKLAGFGILVILVLIGFMVWPLWQASIRIYAHAEAGRQALQDAEAAMGEFDIDGALDSLDTASEHFAFAGSDLERFRPFARVPYVGPHIEAADRVLASGTVAISALEDVLGVVADILDVVSESETLSGALSGSIPEAGLAFTELAVEQKRAILGTFASSAPRIGLALDKIESAKMSLDRVMEDERVSPQFRDSLESVHDKLASLQESLSLLRPATETLPSLLGYPEQRTYLVFFQNNTELRPTGGFLGVVGLLDVKDGELVSVETDDVYRYDGPSEAVERPVPPEPIRKYIGIDQWYLRDANWSPDFTVSADIMDRFFREEAEVLYAGEHPVPDIDGIIAFTPEIAADLLRITGPVTVRGVTFTADNLVDELEFQVEQAYIGEGIPPWERKDIVEELTYTMIDRLSGMRLLDLVRVAVAVRQNLEESHILLWMLDPKVQRIVLENDWGGKMQTVYDDYFSVIDANLASFKSDAVVSRDIAYSFVPEGDGFLATVSVTYDHDGRFDWKTTRYRTYVRLYVPKGSEFVEVRGAMVDDKIKDPSRRPGTADVWDELDRTVFGAFISTEPQEERTITFVYRLAPSVIEDIRAGEYRLYAEKQPGTAGHGLTLDLDFGKTLISAGPGEIPSEHGDSRYRLDTDLRMDREFEVRF